MKCKFCGSSKTKTVELTDFVETVPAGLTRGTFAEFKGLKCLKCRSVESTNKFNPENYRQGFYSNSKGYDRVEFCYDYTGDLITFLQTHAKSVLELGAGQGATAGHLKQLGLDVAVLEPDKGYQNILRQNFSEVYSGISDVKRRFDAAVSIGVLEHVEDPYKHIMDVFESVLSTNGLMICQFPNICGLSARLNLKKWDMIFEPGHNHLPSVKGLKHMLQGSGIQISHAYSSSITSRGRVPFLPLRRDRLEKKYKYLTERYSMLAKFNKICWDLQSRIGLGETTVIIMERVQ